MKKALVYACLIITILAGAAYLTLKASSSRSFQVFGELVAEAEVDAKVVALTFDDGPTPEKTDEVLAILDELDVKATFFVTGSELEANLNEGKKIVAAGHELGNHSYSHTRMIFKSSSFIKHEILTTDDLIKEAGYQGDIHFRPPYGKKLVLLPYYLNKYNKRTITWNIEPESYAEIAGSSDKIVDHVVNNVKPGSIILLHVMYESRNPSIEAIEGIVKQLREQGYTFQTVSELIAIGSR